MISLQTFEHIKQKRNAAGLAPANALTGSSSHSLGYPVGSSRQSDVTKFRSQSSEKQLQMFNT